MGRITKNIYYMLIGFLINSLLMRVTGNLPKDDIAFPSVILAMVVVSTLFSEFFDKR